MNKQQAINLLKNLEQSLDDYCELNDEGKTAFRMAITALEVFGISEQLPAAQQEQRWIPCSERLPEDGKKHYWVCTDTGYQCECRWTNINHFWTDLTTNWHWHIMDIPQYSAVIAWMPLPEPWKEGEQE